MIPTPSSPPPLEYAAPPPPSRTRCQAAAREVRAAGLLVAVFCFSAAAAAFTSAFVQTSNHAEPLLFDAFLLAPGVIGVVYILLSYKIASANKPAIITTLALTTIPLAFVLFIVFPPTWRALISPNPWTASPYLLFGGIPIFFLAKIVLDLSRSLL